VAMFAYDCAAAANCTVPSATALAADAFSLGPQCSLCDTECQGTLTDEIKEGLEPATIVGICTAVTSLVTLLWNQYLLTSDWEDDTYTKDTLLGKLGMAWNGLVMFMGFLCTIFGGIALGYIQSECPEGYEDECSNWSILFFIGVSAFLFLTGLTAVVGILKDEGLMLRYANLSLFLLTVLMIIVTTVVGFSSGFVPTIQELYEDEKFSEEILNVATNPHYAACKCTDELKTDCDDSSLIDESGESLYCGCDATLVDGEAPLLTIAQCKGRLQVMTLDNMKIIGFVTLVMVAGSIGVNVVTMIAVMAFHKDRLLAREEDWDDAVPLDDGE
jgi:hypothetical protein